jgi:hypothetical protein
MPDVQVGLCRTVINCDHPKTYYPRQPVTGFVHQPKAMDASPNTTNAAISLTECFGILRIAIEGMVGA